jgi:hypothetical protein
LCRCLLFLKVNFYYIYMRINNLAVLLIFILSIGYKEKANGQTDTLRILSYNVLYLGDTPPCQGPHNVYEGYVETITAYTNPDIIGFNKMEAIPIYAGDNSGNAPAGFADSLLQYSFNAAFPGRYAYCTYTNASQADNMGILFYNQQKLGFAGILCTYSNITDFNTYKLYYKSADLATTHDTVFLYVTVNHDNSGTGSSDLAARANQIAGEMAQIETHFTSLPNMINMGDFNTHSSAEACYQTLVAPANLNYRYYDPPFYPDGTFSYPANWDDDPDTYAPCLTVSTRLSGSVPNSCTGNSGGAKSWYDHIFLSASIINNAARISYIPHSFRVVGNDGKRTGIAANASSPANTSAPADVVNDIFQMSEHYPIMVDLLVGAADNAVAAVKAKEETITVANPVQSELAVRLSPGLSGKAINMTCIDALGRVQINNTFQCTGGAISLPCTLTPGIYYLKFTSDGGIIAEMMVEKR